MLGDYTQRGGKWLMMDMEAIPLYFQKINGLNFGEESRPLWFNDGALRMTFLYFGHDHLLYFTQGGLC
jgi:hypothetical protein